MSVPYIMSANYITVTLPDGPRTVDHSHHNFKLIREALYSNAEASELLDLIDVRHAVIRYSDGRITIDGDDIVRLDGQAIPDGYIARYALQLLNDHQPLAPVCRFIEKCNENPDRQLVESGDISWFVLSAHYPIDHDGYLLVAKAVNTDFTSKHDRTTLNSPGQIVEMPRHQVTKDPHILCAPGLHLGNWNYVESWGSTRVMCRLHPRDIVSVPYEYHAEKLRVCRYEVLYELTAYRKERVLAETVPIWNDHNVPGNYDITIEWKTPQGAWLQGGVVVHAENRDDAILRAFNELWDDDPQFIRQTATVSYCRLLEPDEDEEDTEEEEPLPEFRIQAVGLTDDGEVRYGNVEVTAVTAEDAEEDFWQRYDSTAVFGVDDIDADAVRIYQVN